MPSNPYRNPLIALVALCCVLLALGIVMRPHDHFPEAEPDRLPPIADEPIAPPPPTEWPASGGRLPEVRAAFASAMPKGAGTPVVDASGNLDPAVIKVAVPNQKGIVELLPGTDQRAIDYLASTKDQQQSMIEDRGPADVDTGGIPANRSGGRASRSVRVNISNR